MNSGFSQLRRRSFLTSAGAAVGLSFLSSSMSATSNAADQVTDSGSSIRITRLDARWVGPAVFIRLETNHGITGWGEIKGLSPVAAQSKI